MKQEGVAQAGRLTAAVLRLASRQGPGRVAVLRVREVADSQRLFIVKTL